MRIEMLSERPFGPDVLGPEADIPATPLAAVRFPHMLPPTDLATHERRACEYIMNWWHGPMDLEGYSAGWFRTRNVTLYYVEGPDNGPPLLFFPGQADPWHTYAPVLEALSHRFHVYLMEHRGHGFSERSVPGDYRVIDYVTDAAQFIKHVVGERTFVTGHSLGGMMCMATWDRYPELVLGLSIEDPPFFQLTGTRYNESWMDRYLFQPVRIKARAYQEGRISLVAAQRHTASWPMVLPPRKVLPQAGQRSKYVDWLMNTKGLAEALKLLPPADREFYLSSFQRYVESGEGGPTSHFMPFPLLEPLEEGWMYTDWRTSCTHLDGQWIYGWDERRALAGLSVPTLFWISDRSIVPIRTDEDCREATDLLSRAKGPTRFIEVENAGHYLHKEASTQFSSTIIETFLPEERQADR